VTVGIDDYHTEEEIKPTKAASSFVTPGGDEESKTPDG